MDVILITFVTLTVLICFFGIKIANWLSDEDSGKTNHAPNPSDIGNMYHSGYRTMLQQTQSPLSSSQGQRRTYSDRRHATPGRVVGF